ncbi:uncharacterized protein [Apostichopus japonicus]|uniref:uncharacterized protein n=1 Tax=Stichopus japonicus TaxID=307972 RepID=UPI003AB6367F
MATTKYNSICISTEKVTPSAKKFPVAFWLIVKGLWLFHYKSVVQDRKCFKCSVHKLMRNRKERLRPDGPPRTKVEVIDSLLLSYDRNNDKWFRKEEAKSNLFVNIQDGDCEVCEVCDTEWWDYFGRTCRYTEEDIGVTRWNHKGSGLLSMGMITIFLSASFYDNILNMEKMWGHSEEIINLINKLCLLTLLASYFLVALLSKLRSHMKGDVPCLAWATTWNVRYLIKRAQLLDLPSKGMPGKYFLFLCMLWPFLNSCYRAIIYFYLSECDFDSHVVTTALFGIIMMETWGLFVYLIYFIRVSFQRQFSLILVYLRDFEGHIDRCRGAILCAFADYNLFKTFCNGYFLLTFPVVVIGVTSHITWQYLLYQVCATDSPIMKTQNFLRWLGLSEISMALFLYIFASGGMSVNYLGLQLHSNVLKLKSAAHALFWDEIVQVVDTTNRGSQLLYLSVFFSTVGIFMSLQFNNQDVTYMNARYNTTNMTIC